MGYVGMASLYNGMNILGVKLVITHFICDLPYTIAVVRCLSPDNMIPSRQVIFVPLRSANVTTDSDELMEELPIVVSSIQYSGGPVIWFVL